MTKHLVTKKQLRWLIADLQTCLDALESVRTPEYGLGAAVCRNILQQADQRVADWLEDSK